MYILKHELDMFWLYFSKVDEKQNMNNFVYMDDKRFQAVYAKKYNK